MSGHHAVIRWDRDHWTLRDLGSRNGTRVDGQPVREQALRRGAVLDFGGVQGWRVESTAPPRPMAVRDDGHLIVGTGAALIVEQGNQAVSAWRQDGVWILEDSDGQRRRAPDEVVVGDRRFDLELPQVGPRTVEAVPVCCRTTRFRFRVPANQEGIQLELVHRGVVRATSRVAAVELLHALARTRREQHALPEDERGWVLTDDAVDMMGYRDRRHLAVVVHRARRVADQAGLQDAVAVVERDLATDCLRFGGRDAQFVRG